MRIRHIGGIALAVGVLVPIVVPATDGLTISTRVLALLLGVIALNLALGFGGLPSLGHGAFMSIGAFTYAILRTRAGIGPVGASLIAIAFSGVAGWVVARGIARLRAPFVALSTSIVAWMVFLGLGAFPGLTGGAGGLVVRQARIHARSLGLAFRVGPVALFEIALVAVALATACSVAAVRRFGPVLAAQREDPAAAATAGIDVIRVRTTTFAASAALAGIAGILITQTAGVADPTTFRPVLSIELVLAVLLGGPGDIAGPFVGLSSLLVVSGAADALGRLLGLPGDTLEPLTAAVLLALVLTLGRGGLMRLLRETRGRVRAAPTSPERADGRPPAPRVQGSSIESRGIVVGFGGLRALDGVSFSAEAGRCHALIGPNGSGKTTLLRVLSGSLTPDAGAVFLDGRELAPGGQRARAQAGVIRTLQRTAIARDTRVRDHVVSGMEASRTIGLAQAIARTPMARAEEHEVAARANALLRTLGLGDSANRAVGMADPGQRRLIQLARALAARPRVLLLDEPSAGLDLNDTRRVLLALSAARDAGTTIVLVAHDLWLVRAIADRVTVLDAGAVIAEGSPEEIAADPRVQEAYLGG